MSGTPIVDLNRWRAARTSEESASRATTLVDGAQALAPQDPAATTAPAPTADEGATAAVLHLPEPPERAVSGAPRSVFGPVMAFGLAQRPPAARPVAVGEGEVPAASSPRLRALRARHLADARGATRGPGR